MNDEAKRLIQEIDDLIDSDSVALLLEKKELLAKAAPEFTVAWSFLASSLIDVARYDDAMRAINIAEKLGRPERQISIYALKGRFYRRRGDFRTAEYWLRKAAALDTEGVHNILLGSLLARRGNFKDAKLAHQKAIELGKADTDEAHLNLGYILRAEKSYRMALEHANKALEICPNYPQALKLKNDLEVVLGFVG